MFLGNGPFQEAEGRRGAIKVRTGMFLNDLPESSMAWVCRGSFQDYSRAPQRKGSVNHVSMSSDPANITTAKECLFEEVQHKMGVESLGNPFEQNSSNGTQFIHISIQFVCNRPRALYMSIRYQHRYSFNTNSRCRSHHSHYTSHNQSIHYNFFRTGVSIYLSHTIHPCHT